MKNISLSLLFIVFAGNMARGQVGFEMGLNMANLAIKSGGATVKTNFKPGFGVGAIAAIAIGGPLYFEPGAFYEMNGCKLSLPTGKYVINTVTIPFNFEYKSGEKCGNRFFIGIGPFVGINVGGSYTINADGPIPATSETLEIGTAKTDDLKQLEVGLGLNVGFQLKMRLYARVHYQMGLTDLNPNSDGNNTMTSSAIGVTVGYLFARCDKYARVPGFKTERGNHWRGMSKAKYSRKVRYMRD